MRILVVGTGVIGVIYGQALSEAGFAVTHLVRRGSSAAANPQVFLDRMDERKGHPRTGQVSYPIHRVDELSPESPFDLIIVPTGADQTQEAVRSLVPVSGRTPFLILSGNWEGTAFLDELLGPGRYLLGYADAGGTIRNDGVYWVNLGPEVHLGLPEGGSRSLLDQIEGLFQKADIRIDHQSNMVHWIWQHLAGTIGYSSGFAKHRSMEAFLNDKELLTVCARATKELFRLCELRGVDLRQYPEASFVNLPVWLVNWLVKWNIRRQESAQRYTAHAGSENSQRETRYYFDQVLGTASGHGYEMPYLKQLGKYIDR